MGTKRLLVAVVLAAFVAACTSTGADYKSQNVTNVDLSKGNFKVVKSGAKGSSSGFKLFAFIPITAPSYARAMTDLRGKAQMEGKASAVTNVTQDQTNIWCLLFSLQELTVTGDIIEFTDGAQPAPQKP
jgi:hypothetical protein